MRYPNLLTHQKRILIKAAANDQEEHWIDNGLLWCKVEQVSGTTESVYNSQQTAKTCEVRVSNQPDVTALDRLYDAWKDRTYLIEEAYEGDRELILQCQIYDELEI